MPARRVPRLSSLVGSLGAALVLAAAFAPATSLVAHAQDGAGPGPMMGPPGGPPMGPMMDPGMGPRMGPRGMGGGYGGGGYDEIAVPGQTQYCHESISAQADAWSYYGPTFTGYQFPPYGGTWGFYAGVGIICRWQPH